MGDEISGLPGFLSREFPRLWGAAWNTWLGLLKYTIVLLIIVAIVCKFASISLRDGAIAFVFAEGVGLLVWIGSRLQYDADLITVAFALDTTDDPGGYTKKILKAFGRIVSEHGLSGIMRYRELPADVRFTSGEQAERYLMKKDIRVLLWGHTITGTSGGVETTRFDVRTSYQYASAQRQGTEGLIISINQSVKRGHWDVQATNSLATMQIVAGNVTEIAIYTLAMCLLAERQERYVLKGVALLEALSVILESKTVGPNFPNLREVKARTEERLIAEYKALAMFYTNEKRDLNAAIEVLEKGLVRNPTDGWFYLDAGAAYWKSGDLERGEKFTKIAAYRLSKSDPQYPLVILNLAFIDLYQGRFRDALRGYRKLGNKLLLTNTVDVIRFMNDEYLRTSKLPLLFGLGFLELHYGDSNLGKESLGLFLDRASSADSQEEDLTLLIEEARKLLGQ